MLVPMFHLTVVGLNLYTVWYDQKYVELPLEDSIRHFPLKARVMFLTIWCIMFQTVYFAIAFLNDTFGSTAPAPKHPPLIRRIKDFLFSVAFTLALFVSLSFWTIYSYDKELIFPEYVARALPAWVNHTTHTLVSVFILLELILTHRNYPKRIAGLTGVASVTVTYTVWFYSIYFMTGFWAYPIFEVLSWTARVAFILLSILFGLVIYVIGEKLNSIVSPKPRKAVNGINGLKVKNN